MSVSSWKRNVILFVGGIVAGLVAWRKKHTSDSQAKEE